MGGPFNLKAEICFLQKTAHSGQIGLGGSLMGLQMWQFGDSDFQKVPFCLIPHGMTHIEVRSA